MISKRQHAAFEKDIINEAQTYTKEASKRLDAEPGQRKTYRKSLAEIYKKMSEKHPDVIAEHYKLETYGMKEGSETMKKAFPYSFKRYFFLLIRTLNGKAPGKMTNKQVYTNSRRLPTTFMVAGTSKRCTIHPYTCPEDPCPYRTNNKKVVMSHNLSRKEKAKPETTRTRIFYRQDKKKDMPAIFMSRDDQINCRFEPVAGSMNPNFWGLPGAIPNQLLDIADTE